MNTTTYLLLPSVASKFLALWTFRVSKSLPIFIHRVLLLGLLLVLPQLALGIPGLVVNYTGWGHLPATVNDTQGVYIFNISDPLDMFNPKNFHPNIDPNIANFPDPANNQSGKNASNRTDTKLIPDGPIGPKPLDPVFNSTNTSSYWWNTNQTYTSMFYSGLQSLQDCTNKNNTDMQSNQITALDASSN